MKAADSRMTEKPEALTPSGLPQTPALSTHPRHHAVARAISLVVHPVAFPILTLAVLLYSATASLTATGRWLVFALALTSLPVTALVVFQVASGRWTDLDVSVRRQRYLLYPFGLVCLTSLALVYIALKAPLVAIAATVSSVVANVVDAVINFRYKVSAHATSAAACAALLVHTLPPIGFVATGAALLVGWSRVALGRHTAGQVALGMAVGVVCVIATFAVLAI
ncbi:MAG TPA: phosphatase PAP2 family protein [Ktedonobacterales bacterium]